MKNKHCLATWGALSAITLAAWAIPARAADQDRTSGSDYSSHSTRAFEHKGFGDVERANKLIGKKVMSSDNQKLGKIDNFVLDLESGRILYAVVSTSLIGGKNYAIAPGLFTDVQSDTVRLNIDKAKFDGAPEFTKDIDKPEQLGQASFVDNVYQYFGQTAWWQGANSPSAGAFHNVHKANDIIGMKVKNASNEDLGKVDNVMLNVPAGRIVYVILNPDSSLNLGNNYLALPPNALTLSSDQKDLVSGLTKDKLTAAPHFDKNEWSSLSSPAFASKVYQYYGKQAWFETGGLQPTGRSDENVYPNKK